LTHTVEPSDNWQYCQTYTRKIVTRHL